MEDFFMFWILPAIGGIIYYAITCFSVRQPGERLHKKFMQLGTLRGKSLAEITDACGLPSSISNSVDANGEPMKIIQWMETSYHIVLLFDAKDICLGVSSETLV